MARIVYTFICLWMVCMALPAQTNKKIRSLQKQQTTLKQNIASQEKNA